MIVPIFLDINGSSELMGVIQFFNKINQDLVHQVDFDYLNAVSQIIGAVVETADELHETWMILY